jgi:hypothetical protein
MVSVFHYPPSSGIGFHLSTVRPVPIGVVKCAHSIDRSYLETHSNRQRTFLIGNAQLINEITLKGGLFAMPKLRSTSVSSRSTHRPPRDGSSHVRRGHERRLSVRSQLRDQPDLSKVARAVIESVMAKTEADAQADHKAAAGREQPHA